MRILLADDDRNLAEIAKLSLEKLGGHKVSVVHDGAAAIALASSEPFDVVLLDQFMPEVDGISAAREIKKRLASPPPVVFLSAESAAERLQLFAFEGIGSIAKPFDPRDLNRALDELLKGAA